MGSSLCGGAAAEMPCAIEEFGSRAKLMVIDRVVCACESGQEGSRVSDSR